ncbi:MAG: AzlD domain-containing protein, partial [Neisseriaceae bacterium]|nr:AzlD domain-containing protein [Neisseriaceae bacterium]
MSWGLLLLLAAIVFVNRYVFLEPRVPVRLPAVFNEALSYSAPCLLTAICGPIIMG